MGPRELPYEDSAWNLHEGGLKTQNSIIKNP